MKNIFVIPILLILSAFSSYCQDLNWVKLNGPYGGKVNCIAVNEQGILFAGVKGIYRSSDDGDNWSEIESLFMETDILRIIPNKTTGVFACSANEIFYSIDNGDNWVKTNYNSGFNINGFAINSAGTAFVATDKGLFKSEDNGNTWIQPNVDLTDSSIYGITITPDDEIYIVTRNNIRKSEDGGLNWSSVYDNKYVISYPCYISSDKQSNVYVNIDRNLISRDKGQNWYEIQSNYSNLDLCDVAEDNDGNVYLCDYYYYDSPYIIVCKSGGDFETQMTHIHFTKIISTKTNKLFAYGEKKGAYQSIDGGKNWIEKNNGLPVSSFNYLVSNSGGDIFVLPDRENIFMSYDFGTSWKIIDGRRRTYSLAIDNSNIIYANFEEMLDWGIYEIDFEKSTNNGKNWNWIWPSIANIICEKMVFDKNDTLYYSTGFGLVRYPSREPYIYPKLNSHNHLSSLSINKNEIIFAASEKEGIFRVSENGDKCKLVKAIDDTSTKYIGVTTGALGYVYSWEKGRLFKSFDEGDNWLEVLSKDSSNYVLDVKADMKGHVFASFKDLGVFWSTDYGDTWLPLNTGLKSKNVNIFNIAPNGIVYAGTIGKGLYSLNLGTAVGEHKNYTIEISISPNPTNDNIKIQINNLEPGNITIKLFDLFGRETGTIYEGSADGNMNLNYNLGNISSGTYFVVLSTAKEKKAYRIIVSK